MKTYSPLCIVLSLVLASSAGTGWGQEGFDFGNVDLGGVGDQQRDPVRVSAQFTAAQGDRPTVLMVTAQIDPDWHVYSLTQPKGGPRATELTLAESDDYEPIGDWRAHPEATSRIDNQVWQGLRIEEHSEQVTWYLPVRLADDVDPEQLTISGNVSLQACKEACIPLEFDFAAEVGDGVPIGPVEVSTPTNVAVEAPSPTPAEPEQFDSPPQSAGVYRAEGSVVTWYGWLAAERVDAGSRTFLYLRAELPEPWHVNAYSKTDTKQGFKPTLIAVEPTADLQFYLPQAEGDLVEKPSPVEGFGTLRYYEQQVTWVVPIEVPADAEPGEYDLEGQVGYQACESSDDGLGSCELAKGATFTTTLEVGDGEAGDVATVSFEPGRYADAAKLAEQVAPDLKAVGAIAGPDLTIIEFAESASAGNLGMIGMLGAALLGGLILNLMPCVLPVIGLKIMAFANQGGESRLRVFTLNLVYVAGLMSVFLLLATLASLTQLGLASSATGNFDWGELNTQTWFKVSMTALVFVMALSFLGVWEIPLPGFAGSSAAAAMASREGYGGAFFKGVLTTILATPCSGPFLGPVFGYTIGQPPHITYLILGFVGLGMALPYLVIGAFPSLVQWLPKPGAWMETFKQLMAFVLLGTVVYLFSTINADYFVPTLALLVGLWFACWLGGSQPVTATPFRRWSAWLGGLAAAGAVGWVAFMPKGETELPWQEFSPAGLAAARETGNTVMVDFTADWCLTCKWNLATALDVPAVDSVVDANGVEVLKADWTDEDPAIKQTLAQLRSRSIPLLAIYPADRPGEVIVLRDTVTQSQVLQALAAAGATEANPESSFLADRPSATESPSATPLADAN